MIQLSDAPVATYQGGTANLRATNLRSQKQPVGVVSSSKINKLFVQGAEQTPAVSQYQSYLYGKQEAAIREASNILGRRLNVHRQFTVAFNGFSVKLTQEQAQKMSQIPGISNVVRSKNRPFMTDQGPAHIGAESAWAGVNTHGNLPVKGEGVIVGIIDTGVNTDHEAFADVGGDGYDHSNPWGQGNYVGDCALDEYESMCNDKLIGVRSYSIITDFFSSPEAQAPDWQHWQPLKQIRPPVGEDYQGHGSHVASTAAGNVIFDTPMLYTQLGDGDGADTGFRFERVSGVAPHANIVSYQVCYPGDKPAYQGCPEEALVAGIEDAIVDGVDVINFSIGGAEKLPWEDPVEMAFLSAREAGILVATAAGNSGTDGNQELLGYIDHSSPWLLNVAATTHGRNMATSDIALENLSGGDATITPPTVTGKGIGETFSGFFKLAANHGDTRCLEPFPAGTFTADDIVVCERGDNARVAKAANVQAGGAGGMVLYNTTSYGTGSDLVADVYPIPTIHIDYNNWSGTYANNYIGLQDWLASGSDHMGTITATTISRVVDPAEADKLAAFSSRGPSSQTREHLIPSVAAPGVDIYAAFADEHPFDSLSLSSDYAFLSGTSMASPHVAGAMALMRQAKPDWTAAEISSALQMTATPVIFNDSLWGEDWQDAGNYRAGSGRIDVEAALAAGLVMDETVENFHNANPQNGGAVRNLNLPELVNMHCERTCSWVRTVTATKDGTWTATPGKVVNWATHPSNQHEQVGIDIAVKPASFTLKAGETQSVVVTATVTATQDAFGTADDIELHSDVTFSSDDGETPNAQWPLVFNFFKGEMPSMLDVVAHRNQGKHTIKDLPLKKIAQGSYRAYAPALASKQTLTLTQDNDTTILLGDYGIHKQIYLPDYSATIDDLDDLTSEHVHVEWQSVPSGAKRVYARVSALSTTAKNAWEAGVPVVSMGRDLNNDGEIQFMDEVMCVSYHEDFDNFCNVADPDAGNYWVVVENAYNFGPWELEDTMELTMGVVTGEIAGNVTVSGPASTNGLEPVDLAINWDMDMAQGDEYLLAIDVGTDANNAGNLGMTSVNLLRGDNEWTASGSQDRARAGDIVDIKLHMMENVSGADRAFEINAVIPEGLTLVPESLNLPSGYAEQLTVEDGKLHLKAEQADTSEWEPRYDFTTNATDAMCRTPDYGDYPTGGSANGGYVDLAQYGLNPILGGNWNDQSYRFDFAWFFGNEHKEYLHYNNADAPYSAFTVSPMGYIQLDQMPLFFQDHRPLPFQDFPDSLIAPFWRGNQTFFDNTSLGVNLVQRPWDLDSQEGITVAYAGDELLIEYDNAATQLKTYDPELGRNVYLNQGDSYDFEMILNMAARFGDGEYEIIMAYDNLDFASQGEHGSIGVKGFTGPRGTYGPYSEYKGTQYAYNDLMSKLSDNLVVCYDYVGPESSQFDITFQVRVDESVAGQDLTIATQASIDGAQQVADHTISVNSNLSLGEFNDITVDENASFDITVAYSDDDSGKNVISVSGDHISYVADDHTPGAEVTITPEANWHGETQVTVTVADALYPTDKVSKSFRLTVVSDGVEPGCTDSNATNYDAGATEDDGSCAYPEPAPETKPKKKKSGGATGTLLLGLLMLLGLGRRYRLTGRQR
ncbi:S8 family serine peptidase [Microbulbifer pacificus]|uniref:S8 family serine peptidase n=1 Tax=Microbulbifer pacificus TaxID=407164 RepID=A0AAU0N0Z9_9GAMM|nr:S8 family serine peptidase [Microbulbifer pacificus]WOX06652.1 S8 family serine peptidase [Microbulbifer pacificus]